MSRQGVRRGYVLIPILSLPSSTGRRKKAGEVTGLFPKRLRQPADGGGGGGAPGGGGGGVLYAGARGGGALGGGGGGEEY